MNVKTESINPSITALVLRRPFSAVVLVGALSITALSAVISNNRQPEAAPLTSEYVPSTYEVKSLQLTSEKTGKAIINLDDFLVTVSFNYEAHEDNYGVPGSEFTTVDITQLSVDHIVTSDGTEFTDFTSHNDHFNINQMIVSYIEKNRLVEAA